MTDCTTFECQECITDPDSECVTKHPKVWVEVYEPALKKCEEERRRCENLKNLLKLIVNKIKK